MANVLETFKNAVGNIFGDELNDPLDKKKGKPKKKGVQEIATPGRMSGRVSREVKSDKPLEDNVPTLDIAAEQSPTLAEQYGTTQVELPKDASEEPKPAKLSKKAMSKAKTVSPEKSEGLSNTFAQAVGGIIPMLIGTALGGVEGGVATGQNVIAAKAAEQKAKDSAADRALKSRGLDIEERAAGVKLLELNAKNNPSLKNRMSGLKGEDKKSLGNILDGKQALFDMKAAMTRGVNKFSPVGDNFYTDARSRFVEAIARMKSGAAISETEYDIFTGMTPGTADEKAVIQRKMDRNFQAMDQRLNILGFEPKEFQFQQDKVATAFENASDDDIAAERARRQGR